MTDLITEIASKHLGKAGDGTIVNPYITPTKVDSSLLVGIPRSLNRVQYSIREESLPFYGYDIINAYEFSTLADNGFPVCGVLKIIYPVNSPNIVESKSLKLYLNSYNMAHHGKKPDQVIYKIEKHIQSDLENVIGAPVSVFFGHDNTPTVGPFNEQFIHLEYSVDVSSLEFNKYNEDPKILEYVEEKGRYFYGSSVLRSNCRVTNQPDWGDVFIIINGKSTVTPESLLQYIVSMRSENHFHEEICECIYKRLNDLLHPNELLVACLYTRRGGIDINPVRASSDKVLMKYASGLITKNYITEKTLRQ